MIGISSIRTQIRSLAEDLSISFLSLSTNTSVKKTEMNPNVTFPHQFGSQVVEGADISAHRSQLAMEFHGQ